MTRYHPKFLAYNRVCLKFWQVYPSLHYYTRWFQCPKIPRQSTFLGLVPGPIPKFADAQICYIKWYNYLHIILYISLFFKSSLDYLQYLIQCTCYVNSFWGTANSSFDFGNFWHFFQILFIHGWLNPWMWNLWLWRASFTVQKTVSVQFSLSVMSDSATPWIAAHQASPSFTTSLSLLKLMSFESVMPSNHLILSCPPLLPPSIFPRIRVFSNESALCIRWPNYWSFSFSISPCNEYSGLISFMIDWFDRPEVQGILKNLLQHHSSKASIPWYFFYGPTLTSIHDHWKNHSLD